MFGINCSAYAVDKVSAVIPMEFLAEREELEREVALQTYHVIGVEEYSVNVESSILIDTTRIQNSIKFDFTCYNFPVVGLVGYEDFSIPYRG